MEDKIIFLYLQVVLFIIMLYAIYTLSISKEPKPFHKWVFMISSVGILFLADKVKLVIWLVGVAIVYVLKYFTTKNKINGRSTT